MVVRRRVVDFARDFVAGLRAVVLRVVDFFAVVLRRVAGLRVVDFARDFVAGLRFVVVERRRVVAIVFVVINICIRRVVTDLLLRCVCTLQKFFSKSPHYLTTLLCT